MMNLDISLRHMTWSNQIFFDQIAELPEDIYGLKASDTEWPIGKVLTHFINAAEWYRYCLTGTKWTELKPITNRETLLSYKPYLLEMDQLMIAESLKDDELKTFIDEGGPVTVLASVILSQAANHTAEHKGQISTILAMHGRSFSLDHLDVWAFNSANK